MKKIAKIAVFLLFNCSLLANDIFIEGRVLDINTYQPISRVNIYIKDSHKGTYSDISGEYKLKITGIKPDKIIIFEHVAYDTLKLSLSELVIQDEIFLQSRLIPTSTIEVVAETEEMDIRKDIPQPVSVIDAKQFEIKGYVDAGDLLRTDYSVQVDEELSGKKTVAIRGGNSDEVIVLYNGIKMNNTYDNIFDLSLIDLTDIQRFEVIRGSNTSLYGPEAFSGVVNIVPKYKQDYNIRFQQRFGTYASGNWGLHLYQNFNRLYGNFSYKQGGAVRKLTGDDDQNSDLENKSENFTGNFTYHFSENAAGEASSSINMMYIRTRLDYENQLDNESLLNFNQLLSSRFYNSSYGITLTTAYQWLDETQHLVSLNYLLERKITNRSFQIGIEKKLKISYFDILFSYQYKNAKLFFKDNRSDLDEIAFGIEEANFTRQHHGFGSVIKFKAPSNSEKIQFIDFDLSFRYDNIRDKQINAELRDSTIAVEEYSFDVFGNNNWEKFITKFSTHLGGGNNYLAYNVYMTIGANIKFPTLYQQISVPQAIGSLPQNVPNLKPEKNHSLEIGLVLMRELRQENGLFGWQINGNYFSNSYENKFRNYFIPGFPVSFYDNVKVASISGFELKPEVFLFNKKMSIATGISKYFISEKAAFPFKYDFKRTLNVSIDHAGYSFQIFWFKEGEQYGWIRNSDSRLTEVILPEFSNLDIHFSKSVELYEFKLFLNFSARNILNDDFKLNGLALRDRRYYLTLGAQY